jgi:hypothetical protein
MSHDELVALAKKSAVNSVSDSSLLDKYRHLFERGFIIGYQYTPDNHHYSLPVLCFGVQRDYRWDNKAKIVARIGWKAGQKMAQRHQQLEELNQSFEINQES